MPLYHADRLLRLEAIGPAEGMPAWANLRAIDHPDCTVDRADLSGPGIYALFLDGALFYLGLHAPADKPVTERWHKHVVAHTLRASNMFMRPRALLDSLTLPGPVGAGLHACLSAETVTRFEALGRGHEPLSPGWRRAMRALPLADGCAPLRTRRYNTTFNKARFAEAHWDVFGPGGEATILSRITCCYERFVPGAGATPSEVKYMGLKRREDDLIRRLRPMCNRETKLGQERLGIAWPEVRDAILDAFATPYPYKSLGPRRAKTLPQPRFA